MASSLKLLSSCFFILLNLWQCSGRIITLLHGPIRSLAHHHEHGAIEPHRTPIRPDHNHHGHGHGHGHGDSPTWSHNLHHHHEHGPSPTWSHALHHSGHGHVHVHGAPIRPGFGLKGSVALHNHHGHGHGHGHGAPTTTVANAGGPDLAHHEWNH
ncbi:hypothetical protein Scep_011285 [Stephania cephalantha]|uniref:Histidine-rich glycoprotein n=1 Tax=Stephania cephalantha TaxID=152367 RepID=A0AAP0JCN7_9MAGN